MTMMIINIYKIYNNEFTYIGSTKNSLSRRMNLHKDGFKNNKSSVLFKHIKCLDDFDKVKIELIKSYEVCDRKHGSIYEQLWINKLKCINKRNCFGISRFTKAHYKLSYSEKIDENNKIWRIKNSEITRERNKKYREENKEQIREKQKKYRDENPEKRKETCDRWLKNNQEKRKEVCANYYRNNKELIQERTKEYRKERSKLEMICECGETIKIVNKSRHLKTKKHADKLNQRLKALEA